MKKIKLITFVLYVFALAQLNAQEPIVEKGFLIIQSTKDYADALKTVKRASSNLDLEINLRGYYEDHEIGLKTDSICGCGEPHGYIPRGRYDDGDYISIEYSDSYKDFAKGYYMVIVASNDINSEQLGKTLLNTKKHYADAYVKNTSVYIGCMH